MSHASLLPVPTGAATLSDSAALLAWLQHPTFLPLLSGVAGHAFYAHAILADALPHWRAYQPDQPLSTKVQSHSDGRWSVSIGTEADVWDEVARWSSQGLLFGGTRGMLDALELAGDHSSARCQALSAALHGTVLAQQPGYRLWLNPQRLQQSLHISDRTAQRALATIGRVLLDQLPLHPPLSQRVLEQLARQPGEYPDMSDVSARLCMGERSLRRHLLEEGTTYKMLLQRYRLELAQRYLQQTLLPVPVIAHLCGYSDVTNFHRAYRRHFQQTPKRSRQAARR